MIFTDAKIDSTKSPENWRFTFGEQTNTGTNFYFAINRIFLFKGLVELMTLGSSGDTLASENNNNLCSRELTGSEHMICLDCSDSVHLILPDKIGCVPSNYRGMFQGPKKEGDLQPSLRTFCPEGYAYLPTTEGGDCVPCLNSTCSRCLREDL